MRGRRSEVVLAIVVAAFVGPAGVAVADPPPKPGAHGPAAKGNTATGHGVARKGHHHVRPRTVVRCQNDDTEQIDEFDSEDDEPLHTVSPGTPEPAGGRCPVSRTRSASPTSSRAAVARVRTPTDGPRRGAEHRTAAYGGDPPAERAETSRAGMSRIRPPLRLIGERRPERPPALDEEPRP